MTITTKGTTQTAPSPQTITVTQLDKVTSCFNTINADGTLSAISSTDYNHALATWAMELSYAAYNYPSGLLLPPIPGLFMGDMSDTATDILHEYGFVDDNPEDDIEEKYMGRKLCSLSWCSSSYNRTQRNNYNR